MKKHFSALLILFTALICFSPLFTFAAEEIDFSKCGSICITVKSPDKKEPLEKIKFDFYRVGEITQKGNKLHYTLADGYKDSGISLDTDSNNEFKKETATVLANFVNCNSIKGISVKTNCNGKAFVGNCRIGLYLVIADKMPSDIPYGQIMPFLISLPSVSDSNTLEYSVNAAPKVPLRSIDDITTTTTSSNQSGTTTKPSDINNTVNSNITSGSYNSTSPTKPSQLPNTGMLKWPVPVMAVAGPLLFAFGYLDVIGRKKRDEK